MEKRIRVGVIGCGAISAAYFKGCAPFPILDIVACADLDVERARAKATEFGVPRACAADELLADPDIQLVLNLTVPKAHAEVNLAVLRAGKHAYCEKPFAVSREEGKPVLALAKKKRLRVGCAPDTFLGGGIQTARKLIDDGAIGQPVAATAFMMTHGPEAWHPNPDFYYQRGGGPMFDMGPYYLTALVNLLGPVKEVTGTARISFPKRTITNPERRFGEKINVEIPTHVVGVLNFASGAVGTIITSFDVWGHTLPRIEVYGADGSLSVPDPNRFDGPVRLLRAGAKEWTDVPLTHRAEVGRGIGLADVAHGIVGRRPHRASGELAFHVLDIMQAIHEASDSGRRVKLKSTCAKPAALPVGLELGELDR